MEDKSIIYFSMKEIKIYTTPICPYCHKAKDLLNSLDIPFEETDLSSNMELRDKLAEETGQRTVPMIYIGDEFIGGSSDLVKLHENGELLTKVQE